MKGFYTQISKGQISGCSIVDIKKGETNFPSQSAHFIIQLNNAVSLLCGYMICFRAQTIQKNQLGIKEINNYIILFFAQFFIHFRGEESFSALFFC